MGKEKITTIELRNLPCTNSCVFQKNCIEEFHNGTCLTKIDDFITSLKKDNNIELYPVPHVLEKIVYYSANQNIKVIIRDGFSNTERKLKI